MRQLTTVRAGGVLPALAAVLVSCASRPAPVSAPMPQATAAAQPAQAVQAPQGIAGKTEGMRKLDGFIPIYLDPKDGRLLLELPGDTTRMLFFVQQSTGLGSNPIGIDRAENGSADVARFERNGRNVLVVLENWNYRGDSPGLARTVAESFPPSTIGALKIETEEGGRILVDATDFVLRDWMNNALTLAAQ